jgi:p-cumate 2,3-dioxygenase alpha subunit
VQAGLGTFREIEWSELSRGINKTGEQLNTDELHLRAFWRQWNKHMSGDSQPHIKAAAAE